MDIMESIFFGIIQGLTEWLPISSSGHLVLAKEWLGVEMPIAYGVVLHFATALVIIFIFWKDVINIIKGVLSPKVQVMNDGNEDNTYWGRVKADPNAIFGWWIILGSLPIAVIGLLFYEVFEGFFSSVFIVALALSGTGIMLILSARSSKMPGRKNMNALDAYTIGLGQGLALIPGFSRSGITISLGLMRNIERETVAKYSILLAVPAIIGAVVWEIPNISANGAGDVGLVPMLAGGITAFCVGFFAIKLLLLIVRKAGFHYFAAYCFGLTALILITL